MDRKRAIVDPRTGDKRDPRKWRGRAGCAQSLGSDGREGDPFSCPGYHPESTPFFDQSFHIPVVWKMDGTLGKQGCDESELPHLLSRSSLHMLTLLP